MTITVANTKHHEDGQPIEVCDPQVDVIDGLYGPITFKLSCEADVIEQMEDDIDANIGPTTVHARGRCAYCGHPIPRGDR